MIGRRQLTRVPTQTISLALLMLAAFPTTAAANETEVPAAIQVISREELQKVGQDVLAQVPFARQFTGGPTPDVPPSKDMGAVVDLINRARVKVGSRPLVWHPIMAQGAQQTANAIALPGAALDHTSLDVRGKAGENIAGGPGRFSASRLAQIWLDESRFFKVGIFPDVCTSGGWQQCGHYTQIIDGKSIYVGCCGVEGANSSLVCWFYPAGNVRGQPVLGAPPPIFGQPPVIAANDPPAEGGYDVREAFSELRIPIVSENLFGQLTLESGYRYSDYGVGSRAISTDTYKLAIDFAPVRDIRFRGNYNRAIRAPNIQELFAPERIVLDPGADACAGAPAGGFDSNAAFGDGRVARPLEIRFVDQLKLGGATSSLGQSAALSPRVFDDFDYNARGHLFGMTMTFGNGSDRVAGLSGMGLQTGIDWKPIDDLLFRGSWAEGFRAPSIGELFGTPSRDHVGVVLKGLAADDDFPDSPIDQVTVEKRVSVEGPFKLIAPGRVLGLQPSCRDDDERDAVLKLIGDAAIKSGFGVTSPVR